MAGTTPLRLVADSPEVARLSDFELFWECYPRKKSKGEAQRAWRQTEGVRPPIEEVLAAIETACRSAQWQEQGGRFIPYPASWLRAWGWADE